MYMCVFKYTTIKKFAVSKIFHTIILFNTFIQQGHIQTHHSFFKTIKKHNFQQW